MSARTSKEPPSSRIAVTPIKTQDFEAVAECASWVVTMTLRGNADLRVNAPLETFVQQVRTEAARLKAKEVVVDFRELEFMNSSCFKAFVSWLAQVEDIEPEERYKIRFLSDGKKHWQKRSLVALANFAADVVQIE